MFVQLQLDSISHQLLSSLSATVPGKQCESRMYDANIACRRLAAEHPILMLRLLLFHYQVIVTIKIYFIILIYFVRSRKLSYRKKIS